MDIKYDYCYMCEITNYKNNKGKKQSVAKCADGNYYCKDHFKMLKGFIEYMQTKSAKETLEYLIKEGERLGRKYNL